ncbi:MULTISPECIES: hypothetical protein [unclassified Leptolyngbya]|uniref:hypothetical protein n=1 Tax=unclassified Leptolyngbya TaxID=2650499 RepID=UPI00168272BD|nr:MULTISPECIES: hypothetical protein [unclassified Leptolyngbya]MBD1910838.1 hypothetical protein [Leptolyngbya sp. FACHB-8]MBD2153767.1 hypothetical protein [Leptolyngbya sp. FACHB-16]
MTGIDLLFLLVISLSFVLGMYTNPEKKKEKKTDEQLVAEYLAKLLTQGVKIRND